MNNDYYNKLFDYVVNKNRLFRIKIINVQKKLLELMIYSPPNHGVPSTIIKVDVWSHRRRLASITFDVDMYNKDDPLFVHIFTVIETQNFCFEKYCDSLIVDADDMIDDKCLACYYTDKTNKKCDIECAICLEMNDLKSIELNCNHMFHKTCLFKSAEKKCDDHIHIKCPLCRNEVQLTYQLKPIANEECEIALLEE
jgi:hypothetical protein